MIESGGTRVFYSGDTGYGRHFRQIGQRFGPFELALIENGAYDEQWPTVHMQPEQTLQAFQDLRAGLLVPVHNSTFDLAFHPWQEPLQRISALAAQQQLAVATPEIGEVLTLGAARSNRAWWQDLR